jgi:hypothetical protein
VPQSSVPASQPKIAALLTRPAQDSALARKPQALPSYSAASGICRRTYWNSTFPSSCVSPTWTLPFGASGPSAQGSVPLCRWTPVRVGVKYGPEV